jgi:hypothetical protein
VSGQISTSSDGIENVSNVGFDHCRSQPGAMPLCSTYTLEGFNTFTNNTEYKSSDDSASQVCGIARDSRRLNDMTMTAINMANTLGGAVAELNPWIIAKNMPARKESHQAVVEEDKVSISMDSHHARQQTQYGDHYEEFPVLRQSLWPNSDPDEAHHQPLVEAIHSPEDPQKFSPVDVYRNPTVGSTRTTSHWNVTRRQPFGFQSPPQSSPVRNKNREGNLTWERRSLSRMDRDGRRQTKISFGKVQRKRPGRTMLKSARDVGAEMSNLANEKILSHFRVGNQSSTVSPHKKDSSSSKGPRGRRKATHLPVHADPDLETFPGGLDISEHAPMRDGSPEGDLQTCLLGRQHSAVMKTPQRQQHIQSELLPLEIDSQGEETFHLVLFVQPLSLIDLLRCESNFDPYVRGEDLEVAAWMTMGEIDVQEIGVKLSGLLCHLGILDREATQDLQVEIMNSLRESSMGMLT